MAKLRARGQGPPRTTGVDRASAVIHSPSSKDVASAACLQQQSGIGAISAIAAPRFDAQRGFVSIEKLHSAQLSQFAQAIFSSHQP